MNCRFRTVKQFQDIPLCFVLHRYWLDGPSSNPNAGEIFHLRPEWPCAPPSPLYNEYRAFTVVNLPKCGLDHPTKHGAEVKERVEL